MDLLAAAITIFLALVIGGVALIAQAARTSRQAAVSLAVVMLFISTLVVLIGAFVSVAFFSLSTGDVGLPRVALIGGGIAVLVAGLLGLALCVPLFRRVTGREVQSEFWSDPPTVFALWLLLAVLANNVVSFLIFTQETDLTTLFPDGRVSPLVIVSSQLPFIIVAVMGVGFLVRRNFRETLSRLGYGRVSPLQLGIVGLFIMGALAVSLAADALFAAVQPDLYRSVGELSESLFSPRGLGPASVIMFALLIGVGAGLGEETLFRGAMQPVFGVAFTSIVFASMHVQYGPSLLLGYIFVLSVGLGFLRKRINTTASFLAHAGYNASSVILAYFFGM